MMVGWLADSRRGGARLAWEVLSRRASGGRDVLADLPRLANLAHAYSKPLVDILRPTAAHTNFERRGLIALPTRPRMSYAG